VDFTEAVNYDSDVREDEVRKAKFSRCEAVRLLYKFDIELVD
jgi:fluoroquinolone resistance protein